MRVGFDSDGVLDNFGEGVHDTLIARGLGHLWKSGPTERPFWNFYEDWGWSYAEFKELVDWGVDNGYVFSGHWRDGAVDAVRRIAQLGHEIIIITDRSFGTSPLHSQSTTIEAFQRAGIEYDELIFSPDKTVGNVDMMVEDKWENFVACTNAGIDTYLVTRPWNEDRGWHPKRIASVSEYADAVELATANGFVDLALV